MNRHITNFPEEALFAKEDGGRMFLAFPPRRFVRVSEEDRARLAALLPKDDTGKDVYVSAVLVKPYIDNYLSTDWTDIAACRYDASHILNAIARKKAAGIILSYKGGGLRGASVQVIRDTGRNFYTYKVPEFALRPSVRMWRLPSAQSPAEMALEGDFDLVLKAGGLFRAVLSGIEAGLVEVYRQRGRRIKSETLVEQQRWQILPYINAVYLYVKENIKALSATDAPLDFTAKVLGRPEIVRKFGDIIGRGVKKVTV